MDGAITALRDLVQDRQTSCAKLKAAPVHCWCQVQWKRTARLLKMTLTFNEGDLFIQSRQLNKKYIQIHSATGYFEAHFKMEQ